jgi:hypothetical protein
VRPLLYHLPLLGSLSIIGFFTLVEAGWLPSFRTEETYGWMVVVWYPLCILLALTQIALWVRWIVLVLSKGKRGEGRS